MNYMIVHGEGCDDYGRITGLHTLKINLAGQAGEIDPDVWGAMLTALARDVNAWSHENASCFDLVTYQGNVLVMSIKAIQTPGLPSLGKQVAEFVDGRLQFYRSINAYLGTVRCALSRREEVDLLLSVTEPGNGHGEIHHAG